MRVLLAGMFEGLPEPHEEDVILAQAARMDFAFARHVQQRALESDDAKELAELARAYTDEQTSPAHGLARRPSVQSVVHSNSACGAPGVAGTRRLPSLPFSGSK